MQFDTLIFYYPSISEMLLDRAFVYARQITDISDRDINIIIHPRKTPLFNQNSTSVKRADSKGFFDVVVGKYMTALTFAAQ